MITRAISHGGYSDTVRQSALKVNSWRKISCRNKESNLPQRCVGLTLYQLSFISIPFGWFLTFSTQSSPINIWGSDSLFMSLGKKKKLDWKTVGKQSEWPGEAEIRIKKNNSWQQAEQAKWTFSNLGLKKEHFCDNSSFSQELLVLVSAFPISGFTNGKERLSPQDWTVKFSYRGSQG